MSGCYSALLGSLGVTPPNTKAMNLKIEAIKTTLGMGARAGAATAEEMVNSYMQKMKETDGIEKLTVCVIGSGNWGSTAAKIIGENIQNGEASRFANNEVRMWVFDEDIKQDDGSVRKLSEIINTDHENVKFLPGVKLPTNVKAVPDVRQAVDGAHVLVWVLPHQFIPRTAASVKDVIHPKAISISMVKGGVDITRDGLKLCSETIAGIVGHDVSVIMGANVANEVARGDFCEATVGATDAVTGAVHQTLFTSKTFSVNVVNEVASVELCGAIKNVVALAAGFTDGLGMGSNTKAAIVRLGLKEMELFIRHFYPETSSHVFFESCGVADLITTCFAGRNRKCAEAFAASRVEGKKREWDDLEKELLNGQKLQGVLTAMEIYPLIELRRLQPQLPLICATYEIACCGAHPKALFELLDKGHEEGTFGKQITLSRNTSQVGLTRSASGTWTDGALRASKQGIPA
jgi:glycerol-3-phosphate dehydrogenase (NAD+)